ncbi:MAG TPA: class I SAM-dependent methyltransferase [Pyrinomonadaceae bacterium]|nr:class I SAM-dependent methyltransferase [Pyrinomonadaceae bacterium]
MAKSFFDRTALALFKTIPTKAAQHLLFLAQSERELSDRWGYHIRPIHYYEPLPDFRSITAEQIERRHSYPAIDFNWSSQLALLHELTRYREELVELTFDFQNDYFSGFDAAAYYSLIRHLKPERIVEIGGGYSTRIAVDSLTVNRIGHLTCIEPYPEERLNGTSDRVELIRKRVEEIDLAFFSSLKANDILFIDSSHTVKFGSDVCYEVLEILPSLAPGVWVHVHDIFFPHDYPAEWLIKRRLALNEQYLLEAFLAFNKDFQVVLSNYWLCLQYLNDAARLWPDAVSQRHCSSSFWMKSIA